MAWLALVAALASFPVLSSRGAEDLGDVQFALSQAVVAHGQDTVALPFSILDIPAGGRLEGFGFGVSFPTNQFMFEGAELTIPGEGELFVPAQYYDTKTGNSYVFIEVQSSPPAPFGGGEAVTLRLRPILDTEDLDGERGPSVICPIELVPGPETWISLTGYTPLWPLAPEDLHAGSVEIYVKNGLTVASVVGPRAGFVDVPLLLTTLGPVHSLSAGIDYDEDMLEFLSVTPVDDLADALSLFRGLSRDGRLWISLAAQDSGLAYPQASVPIAVARFWIKENVTAGSRVAIGTADDYILINGSEKVPTFFLPGVLTVVENVDGRFLRGDVNLDGSVNTSDAVAIFTYLFRKGEIPCLDAADINDDGRIDVGDGTGLLTFLFRGGTPPRPPYPEPGLDPTSDGFTGCGNDP
jgi:hypothetical protein